MGKDVNPKGHSSAKLHIKITILRYMKKKKKNFRKLTRTKLFYSHKNHVRKYSKD